MTNPQIPKFICFVGVDGSGKTYHLEQLKATLELQERRVHTTWLRMNYMLTKPVLLFCRLTGLTARVPVDDTVISVHHFYKAPGIAKAVQVLHTIDTYIAFVIKVLIPMKLQNKTVLCDRFVYDVLIDFIVESRDDTLYQSRIARWLQVLVPKNSIVFLLKTDKAEILKRRPDVTRYDHDFETRYIHYSELDTRYPQLVVIDNNLNQDIAVKLVLRRVIEILK